MLFILPFRMLHRSILAQSLQTCLQSPTDAYTTPLTQLCASQLTAVMKLRETALAVLQATIQIYGHAGRQLLIAPCRSGQIGRQLSVKPGALWDPLPALRRDDSVHFLTRRVNHGLRPSLHSLAWKSGIHVAIRPYPLLPLKL